MNSLRVVALPCITLLTVACGGPDPRFTGYARQVALTGDSAFAAVAPYRDVKAPAELAYRDSLSRLLERQSMAFAVLVPHDSVLALHRQMTEGLDTLVIALRTLRERETSCSDATRIDCADDRDLRAILASFRAGDSIYLGARRRMRAALADRGVSLAELH